MGRFLAIFIVIAALVWWFSRNPGTTSATPDQVVAPASNPVPVIHAIGQEFSVGYWSYLCNSARSVPMIPSMGGPAEFPDGVFVLIDITVQNNDKSSSTLPPFELLDTEGRKYDASSKPMWEGRFFGPLEDLNPGISKRGLVAFDVPPNRQYTLQVGGGFESGKSALVNITTPATPASNPQPGDPCMDNPLSAGCPGSTPEPASEKPEVPQRQEGQPAPPLHVPAMPSVPPDQNPDEGK